MQVERESHFAWLHQNSKSNVHEIFSAIRNMSQYQFFMFLFRSKSGCKQWWLKRIVSCSIEKYGDSGHDTIWIGHALVVWPNAEGTPFNAKDANWSASLNFRIAIAWRFRFAFSVIAFNWHLTTPRFVSWSHRLNGRRLTQPLACGSHEQTMNSYFVINYISRITTSLVKKISCCSIRESVCSRAKNRNVFVVGSISFLCACVQKHSNPCRRQGMWIRLFTWMKMKDVARLHLCHLMWRDEWCSLECVTHVRIDHSKLIIDIIQKCRHFVACSVYYCVSRAHEIFEY